MCCALIKNNIEMESYVSFKFVIELTSVLMLKKFIGQDLGRNIFSLTNDVTLSG
jgi:hypothetical protein